jgi:hypothetical protein
MYSNGVYIIPSSGSYDGSLTVYVPALTTDSTYAFSLAALYLGEQIVSVPMSIVVGGGQSTYYCTELNFNVNITRAFIGANGQVVSSIPLDNVFGKPPVPADPIVAYITTITASAIPQAVGGFIVTYQALGTGSEISPNSQGQILTSGPGWSLYQFEQQISLSGGKYDVELNATDLLAGEYAAFNDSSAISKLNDFNVGRSPGTDFGTQLEIAEGFSNPWDIVNVGVSIQGCNSQSSSLQAFTDMLSIPISATSTATISTFNTAAWCVSHRVYCKAGIYPTTLNLLSGSSFSVLGYPEGSHAFLIGLGDILVVIGIAGAIVLVKHEYF